MNSQKNSVKLQTISNTCTLCHAKDFCMASSMEASDLEYFQNVVGHRSPMQKGERLFLAGEDIHSIFILHSGSVKSYVESIDGDNQITGFHLPGDVIGIHGVENKIHDDTVEALETSSVCELRFTNFEDICSTFPIMHKHLIRYVFRELSHEQEMMLVLGKMSAERRMAHFLLDMASRLNAHGLSSVKLNLTMTRHDIANYLGLAVETVSRLLTRFQNSNIIHVDRKSVVIEDQEALEDIFENHQDKTLKSSTLQNKSTRE